MALCPIENCEEHLGCRLRKGGGLFQMGRGTQPTKTRRHTYRPPARPSWEAGIAGEHRPDGSFMPYLDSERAEMGVKEFSERRHEVEAQVARLKTDPTVFAREREATSS